jgi:6-phosphogluconolactonase (cycloisomerase 2 family)
MWLALGIGFVAGCAEEVVTLSETCPWYVRCGGECGVCDDGNPCTLDTCVSGFCVHLPEPESCRCLDNCASEVGVPRLAHALARGAGGTPSPIGPTNVAVAANERDIYVASADNQELVHVVWADDVLQYGESWATEEITGVAVHPGGAQVYTVGAQLRLWSRDDQGRLEPTNISADGGAAVYARDVVAVAGDGELRVHEPTSLALLGATQSPDVVGAHRLVFTADGQVLVPGFSTNAVTRWRWTGSGLEFTGKVTNQRGLAAPQDIAISRDGSLAYVAGYCDHAIAIVSLGPEGISWIGSETDAPATNGDCAPLNTGQSVSQRPTLEHPSALAMHSSGAFLYVASKSRNLKVLVYTVDGSSLQLAGALDDSPPYDDYSDEEFHLIPPELPNPFDVDPVGHRDNASLVPLASGKIVTATRYGNAIGIVDGSATTGWLQRGQGGVGSIPGAYNLALSADEKNVYVAPRTHSDVGAFSFDADTGRLTELPQVEVPRDGPEPGGITNVFVSPDGGQVYAVDTTPPAVYIHDRSPEDGSLTYRATAPIPSCNGTPPLPVDIQVTSDGAAVIVADFQDLEAGASCVLSYPRAADGSLGEPYIIDDDIVAGVESFAITRDGREIYAANFHAASVARYVRSPGSHILTPGGAVVRDDLAGAEFAVLSQDETRLWVSSPVFHKLIAFQRDASGGLTHVQTLEFPALPIKGAAGLSVHPDGSRLWLASRLSETITTFAIAEDGSLSLIDTIDSNTPSVADSVGMSGLVGTHRPPNSWVNGLEVTADGRWILTSAVASSTVASWRVSDGTAASCPSACAPD